MLGVLADGRVFGESDHRGGDAGVGEGVWVCKEAGVFGVDVVGGRGCCARQLHEQNVGQVSLPVSMIQVSSAAGEPTCGSCYWCGVIAHPIEIRFARTFVRDRISASLNADLGLIREPWADRAASRRVRKKPRAHSGKTGAGNGRRRVPENAQTPNWPQAGDASQFPATPKNRTRRSPVIMGGAASSMKTIRPAPGMVSAYRHFRDGSASAEPCPF